MAENHAVRGKSEEELPISLMSRMQSSSTAVMHPITPRARKLLAPFALVQPACLEHLDDGTKCEPRIDRERTYSTGETGAGTCCRPAG